MAVCGTISNYNALAPETIEDPMWRFITRRLKVEGFLVTDFEAAFGEFPTATRIRPLVNSPVTAEI